MQLKNNFRNLRRPEKQRVFLGHNADTFSQNLTPNADEDCFSRSARRKKPIEKFRQRN